jgi:hypothetical protein
VWNSLLDGREVAMAIQKPTFRPNVSRAPVVAADGQKTEKMSVPSPNATFCSPDFAKDGTLGEGGKHFLV